MRAWVGPMLSPAQPAIFADGAETFVEQEPTSAVDRFVLFAQRMGVSVAGERTQWEDVADAASVHEDAALSPQPASLGLKFSGDVALVSDYRIAGVSSSGRAPALQGEIDVDAPYGWSGGVWASNIKEFAGAHTEIDVYASKSIDFGDTEFSLGATAIWLAGGKNVAVGIATASVSRPIGPIDATLSVRYAWRQARLEGADDMDVSASVKTPIGALGGVPLTAGASLGYEDGIFVTENKKTDWSLSLTANVHGVDIGVSYVDANVRDPNAAAACLFSITRSF